MGATTIRMAIQAASEYLAEHPEQARSTDGAASASLVDGLVVRVTGPSGASITTDMVQSVGGTATAPSPGWLLRAAEASCVVTLIAMRAAMLGITLDTLDVTVDSESDDRGILGIDELKYNIPLAICPDGVDDLSPILRPEPQRDELRPAPREPIPHRLEHPRPASRERCLESA